MESQPVPCASRARSGGNLLLMVFAHSVSLVLVPCGPDTAVAAQQQL